MQFKASKVVCGSDLITAEAFATRFGVANTQRVQAASGIVETRVCSIDEDCFDLAAEALNSYEIKPHLKKCDGFIVVSEHTSGIVPPPSSFILSEIDCADKLVIDLNRGCSGFAEALLLSSSLLKQAIVSRVAIVCADNYSKYFDPDNRSVAMIFGDAASVTIVENSVESSICFNVGSLPKESHHIKYFDKPDGLMMDGGNVLTFVKAQVLPKVEELCVQNNNMPEYFFVHQGSKLVVDLFREKFDLNEDTCPFVIAKTGNLNSSSVPMILSDMEGRRDLVGKTAVISCFGVGLSFANLVLTLNGDLFGV